jgi:putative transposase
MGKKRHIQVDTQGLLIHAIVHAADIQDRDGGAVLIATLFSAFPFLTRLFAAGGYRESKIPERHRTNSGERDGRDRQAVGSRQSLRRPARALDRRTQSRLARPLSQTGQGLGVPQPRGARLPRLASIRLMLRKLCNPHNVSGQTLRTLALSAFKTADWE